VALRAAARRSRGLRLWCVYLDRGREPPSLRFLLGLRRRRSRVPPAPEPVGRPKVTETSVLPRDV
jgi:hypothetical protein